MGIRIHVREEDKNESILNPNNLLQFDISIVLGSPAAQCQLCVMTEAKSETWHVSRTVFVMITLMTSHRRLHCLTLPVSPCPMSVAWDRGGDTQPQLSSGSESRRHNQRAQSDLGLETRREVSECQEKQDCHKLNNRLCDAYSYFLHIMVVFHVPLHLHVL